MATRPSYGANKMPLIGWVQKVDTQARTTQNDDLGSSQTEFTHKPEKRRFRFNIINNEYVKKTYAELMPNYKLKDSSVVIRTYADIEFEMDEKITSQVGISGIISGEPSIKTLTEGYGNSLTRKETIIIIDG